jgi:hypothetical protein|tara:strand:+ start:451 stop:1518 length:1068 start_codon:yes stop_codon:yes gene_type:complete
MVAAGTNPGLASSQLSDTANRVLIDYKDAIQDYKVTEMPVVSMFAERFTTDTGGDVDITFAKPSMGLEQIEEGATPAYQHTDLRNERVSVKEYGIAVGVTRRMLEDSRFSEMELALNEARKAVERHVTKHFVYAVFGLVDATFGTTAIAAATAETAIETFASNPHGGFYGANPSSGTRLYEYGNYDTDALNTMGGHYFASQDTSASESTTGGNLELTDITKAIELMSAKGMVPDTILVSPTHYKTLLNLADFTAPFGTTGTSRESSKGGLDYVNETSNNGVVGQLYGLNVVVNPYVPQTRAGIFDMKVKPVAYVERRGLTVEEANPGFGITGSYMSMRYGLKVIRPEAGVIIISD